MYIKDRAKKLFKTKVLTKFHLFRSLLLSLPFKNIQRDGVLLSFFVEHVEKQLSSGKTTEEIVDSFFKLYASTMEADKNILFQLNLSSKDTVQVSREDGEALEQEQMDEGNKNTKEYFHKKNSRFIFSIYPIH